MLVEANALRRQVADTTVGLVATRFCLADLFFFAAVKRRVRNLCAKRAQRPLAPTIYVPSDPKSVALALEEERRYSEERMRAYYADGDLYTPRPPPNY